MKREFIPLDQALEMKELGFKEPSLGWYNLDELEIEETSLERLEGTYKTVLAPTFSQAFRWFRDKHNLKGGIMYIGGLKPETTWWDIYVVGHYNISYDDMELKYQPYEEAEEALLIKLIELAKNK